MIPRYELSGVARSAALFRTGQCCRMGPRGRRLRWQPYHMLDVLFFFLREKRGTRNGCKKQKGPHANGIRPFVRIISLLRQLRSMSQNLSVLTAEADRDLRDLSLAKH